MSHHIEDILSHWQSAPDDGWVLAVITRVQGSSYRKAGAIMLFHPLGRSIGLISGGCLEAELRRHAIRAIQDSQAIEICFDARDESDVSYQLGCGGIVELMLVPLNRENHYLQLHKLAQVLNAGGECFYLLPLAGDGTDAARVDAEVVLAQEAPFPRADFRRGGILQAGDGTRLDTLVVPMRSRFHLAIFGGGLDSQPLARIANQLGWRVTVIDERSSHARQHDFPAAKIIKQGAETIETWVFERFDAAVVMQHNLSLDAKALIALKDADIAYLAMLGPAHRRDRVLVIAGLTREDFSGFFSAPAGLALGGELPESVALSILAQCHGVLHGARQVALDRVML